MDHSVNPSSSRKLVVVMAGVAVSFLLSTALTQYRESMIENRVNDLVGNAIPSVKSLISARTHLRDAVEHLDEFLAQNHRQTSALVQTIRSEVEDVKESFHAYMTLPFFPAERELANPVAGQVASFADAMEAFFAVVPKDNRKAFSEALPKVHGQGLLLDHGLLRLAEFNATQGQRLGTEISFVRSQSLVIAVVLDLVSVGLAILATFMSVRMKNSSMRQLEDRARELEIFAGRVAHDLKNPLATMILSGSLLHDMNLGESASKLVERSNITGGRMNQIIDDLLTFATSGARPESGASADLAGVLEATMVAVRPDGDQVHVHFEIEPVQRPHFLACSEGVLASILSNLIRNALKFIVGGTAPSRKIRVRVRDAQGSTRIEIEDNGPGIEPDKLRTIFNPYYRIDSKYPGLGLGLATVKRLVEAHGGKVGVTSTLGRGSCFFVELPRALRTEAAPSRQESAFNSQEV